MKQLIAGSFCEQCENGKMVVQDRRNRYGSHYTVVKCDMCGHDPSRCDSCGELLGVCECELDRAPDPRELRLNAEES